MRTFCDKIGKCFTFGNHQRRNMTDTATRQKIDISQAPMNGRHVWIVIVSSMEQLIGAGLSTLAGIIIPMINLVLHPELSAGMQGLAGAAGLIGIAAGSPVIGRMADKWGYLFLFRLCPIIIMGGALTVFFTTDIWWTIFGLFLTGVGVGGGYSLDSAYISELMPTKWKLTMVGVAKASSALGFIGIALASYFIIRATDTARAWPILSLTLFALGLLTFMMRVKWAESPQWCLRHGQTLRARRALDYFFGPDVVCNTDDKPAQEANASYLSLFKGQNLTKVIFSGIPWACEGVGVYGVGVFLPVLVMALGIESPLLHGLHKITDSVILTAVINCFILLGFITGILMLRRVSHLKMLIDGFVVAAIGLGVILAGYLFHLPSVVMLIGFLVFEFFLNVGPHLITFIIPPHVFDPAQRAAGNGIAAFLGKVGAIAGVFLMPWLLHLGGMTLVLAVCIAVNLLGALIAAVFGRKLYKE